MVNKIAVVGLGYVGLPVAIEFGKKIATIGYDVSKEKIIAYKKGRDPAGEIDSSEFAMARYLEFTADPSRLREADFIIVAVPTPINIHKLPDLGHLISASRTIGANLSPGAIVVYESTVYPGVTEEICLPVLEEASGLKAGVDFKVAYSPERINPGDKEHTLARVVKVVAAQDEETLEVVARTYEMVVEAGVYRAPSIKVAEAAKVIENTQRDLNIALMNELAIIFNLMGLDTLEVLECAGTKWNFLPFRPGLVGGHCIGVDPYYLTYKAQELGYHPQVILAGRRINDSMGVYVAQKTIKEMIKAGIRVDGARVGVLGLTFKENCRDIRNTLVIDIILELREYGIEPEVHDPLADPREAERLYGLRLYPSPPLGLDAVILAVAHDAYRELGPEGLISTLRPGRGVIIDVKGLFGPSDFARSPYRYWRL
ncbi:nucleotide sugar dehydrogenase [Thermosulfuriphilus sp.]